jgi:C4-dicarboxylate-binding protein DctP
VPLPPSELYVALQNGVVDCALMTPSITVAARLYEVAPYYTDTDMAGNITISIMNLAAWKKLPDAQRAAIRKVSDEMTRTASVKMRESAATNLKELEGLGKVYRLSAEERAEFVANTSPVFDQVANAVKDEPGATMIKKLSSFRK